MISNSKRGKSKMSTQQPEKEAEKAETEVKETEKVSIKKSYEFFDENLVLQQKEVTVEYETFTGEAKPEKVMAKLNEINRWVDAANFLIRNEALKAAKASAGVAGGINRAVLMEYIKSYREIAPFDAMITVSDKRKASAEEWNKQTSAILEQVKNIPFIMNAIRAASAKANATEE